MTTSEEIKSTAYTLRFKHGKQTILVFVEPLTPFPAILKELLATLRERYPDGLPSSTSDEPLPIPKSGIDVVLGVPKDNYDMDKGWDELAVSAAGLKESPKSLGLKDGAMIAFAFADSEHWTNNGEFHVEFSNVDELYPDEE
ncbi:hypothetical protein BKA65DRAFT_465368 [Rhexocercosporidium sp. MPI-PUGE-AT-0058]|nr:hypothetical protein BKA65DRAFT_465368 [Rhexocercosporidium sp. MPI-PUGE-AT-0058]